MKVCFRHYKKNLLSVGFTFKDIFLDNLGGPGLAERPMRAELRFPEEAQILPVCDCFGVRLFQCAIVSVCDCFGLCPDLHPVLPDGLSYQFQTCFICSHNCVNNLLSINL